MAGSWFSRLFTGSTPPAGDDRQHRARQLAELLGYPGAHLRLHQADRDLVAEPQALWAPAEGAGLHAHVLEEPTRPWTDVLLILSRQDFDAATGLGGVPWLVRAQEAVERAYAALRAERPELALPERRLRLRLVADGSGDVKGQSYGLHRGEFMTGLAEHLYAGPRSRSRPRLAIHLNLPELSQGYSRVGFLYDDQLAFTLGSHWLDTYGDPELLEPGLYTLRPLPEGGWDHSIRPDLQDEYSAEAQDQQGVSILTLRRGNRAFAHLIFEVLDHEQDRDFAREATARLRLSFELAEVSARLERLDRERPAAEGRQPNSVVELVVIYADRAMVTRTQRLHLDPGRHTVRFRGLLPTLDRKVLKAELRAGRARITNLRTLSDAQSEAEDRDQLVKDARAALFSLGDIRARVEDLLRQRAALSGAVLAPSAPEPEDGGAITQVRRRIDRLRRSERDLDEEVATLCARAAALDDRLRPILERLTQAPQDGQTAELELEVRAPGEVELGLRYPVSGVRWSPQYRARAIEPTGEVELSCTATVHQATGEVWEGTRVVVSSAVDQRRTEPPPVRPWALEAGPELVALLRAHGNEPLTQLTGADEGTSDPSLMEGAERVSLRDGQEAQVQVLHETLPAEELLVVHPRQEAAVYRQLTLRRAQGGALPEGPVTCFIGNHFVGQGRLAATEAGQSVVLGLGVEGRVQVQRNLVSRERVDDPSLAGRVGHRFHYRTVLMSRRSGTLRLRVVDQLPLPGSPGVEVRMESATSNLGPQGRLDPQDHSVTWDLDLPGMHMAGLDLRFLVVLSTALDSSPDMRLGAAADTLITRT